MRERTPDSAAKAASGADPQASADPTRDVGGGGPVSMITGDCVIEPGAPGLGMANLGEPIVLDGLGVHAVAASAARANDMVTVWTRLAVTSDERIFHRIADSLKDVIEGRAHAVGAHVGLDRANTVFLVIRPDDAGDLWKDAAATTITGLVRRRLAAGSVVFDADIADIGSMDFPLVEIGPKDRVVCLIREGWRFGLYFDFNPDGAFDRTLMTRELGRLLRTLRFSALYDVVSDDALFGRIVDAGWFPFVEIVNRDFAKLSGALENGFDLADAEADILSGFDRDRLERMFGRWMLRPHFAGKEKILRAALERYLSDEPIGAIKIALTEIEGVLQEAYVATFGKGAKLSALLDFAVDSGEQRASGPDTLLFSAAFARYLKDCVFARFDPVARNGKARSRHAVGHGAAMSDSYTRTAALQTLLTLDQISIYT